MRTCSKVNSSDTRKARLREPRRPRKGLFEVADGGSLFLDEIGHTSLALQARLLRVLQERVYTPVGDTRERKTDVRLIAATNRDLDAMVADGSFRQELFYRLSIVPITLPPLRERKEDIPALAVHFLKKFCEENGRAVPSISPEALHLLLDHPWPGNVRELENVMHRISVLSTAATITPADLPVEMGSQTPAVTVVGSANQSGTQRPEEGSAREVHRSRGACFRTRSPPTQRLERLPSRCGSAHATLQLPGPHAPLPNRPAPKS